MLVITSFSTQQDNDAVEVLKKPELGHKQEDAIWQYFEKEHRNYDAKYKCGTTVAGKPEKMKRHLTNDCKKANHGDKLYALKQQAKVGASESDSASTADPTQQPGLSRFI